MSAGIALLRKFLTEGLPLSVLLESGVTRESFSGGERVVYDMVTAYIVEFDTCPQLETVTAETGVQFPDFPDEPIEYWISRVWKRCQSQSVADAAVELTSLAADGEIARARDVARGLYRSLDSKSVSDKIHGLLDGAEAAMQAHDRRQRSPGLQGVPFGLEYLDTVSDGAQGSDTVAVVGRPGVGKCIPVDSLLPTDDGTLCQAGKCDVQPLANWFKEEGRLCYTKPVKVSPVGAKRCLTLVLDNGVELTVSWRHRLFDGNLRNKKEARDFVLGDFMAVPALIPEPRLQSLPLLSNRVLINAAMLAEGGVTTRSTTWTNNDPALVALMRRALIVDGMVLKARSSHNGCVWFIEDLKGHSGLEVRNQLARLGIRRGGARTKAIDAAVFKLPNSQLAVWLGVFYSCDGSKGKHIELTLASKELVYQFRHLLLRFGIYSKIKFKPAKCNGKVFDAWRLTVTGRYHKLFTEQIPIYSTRKLPSQLWQLGNDFIPSFPWLVKFLNKKLKQCWHIKGTRENAFRPSKLFRRGKGTGVNRRQLELMADRYSFREEVGWLLKSVEWAKIVQIKNGGLRECVDVQMPESPWFVCDQCFVHNTYFCLSMANCGFDAGEVPLVVSMEMSVKQCARRIMALRTGVPASMIRLGRLSYFGRDRLITDISGLRQILEDRPFHLMQGSLSSSVEDLAMRVQELRPTVLYVDGAYLLRTNEAHDSRWERVTYTAEYLKMIATEFDIPVIGTYQFNRRGPGSLGNVAFSDSIGMLASIVIGIADESSEDVSNWSPVSYKIVELLKGREGERGVLRAIYDMARMSIRQDRVLKGAGMQALANEGEEDA